MLKDMIKDIVWPSLISISLSLILQTSENIQQHPYLPDNEKSNRTRLVAVNATVRLTSHMTGGYNQSGVLLRTAN